MKTGLGKAVLWESKSLKRGVVIGLISEEGMALRISEKDGTTMLGTFTLKTPVTPTAFAGDFSKGLGTLKNLLRVSPGGVDGQKVITEEGDGIKFDYNVFSEKVRKILNCPKQW